MNEGIVISDITKSYGKTKALVGVSFSVDEGELFGLIGPDGAGKSTLFKILATLLLPDSGNTLMTGLDVVKDYRKLRTEIGYMPEKFSLYQDLTVKENLEFFASLFGVSVQKNFDLIAPIYKQLEQFPNRLAGNLSGGMKQKLALSCALIHRPKVLLLDEPTTGVDAVSRSEFWDMLSDLRKHGITILVSTSYMDEAKLCERIAMINNGHILAVNTPEKLAESIGEILYNASADDMFRLLTELREVQGVKECYTFGATLHIVAENDFSPDLTVKILQKKGLKNVLIYPAHATIEDLFIKLMQNDR